jgi:hypothetical protein
MLMIPSEFQFILKNRVHVQVLYLYIKLNSDNNINEINLQHVQMYCTNIIDGKLVIFNSTCTCITDVQKCTCTIQRIL